MIGVLAGDTVTERSREERRLYEGSLSESSESFEHSVSVLVTVSRRSVCDICRRGRGGVVGMVIERPGLALVTSLSCAEDAERRSVSVSRLAGPWAVGESWDLGSMAPSGVGSGLGGRKRCEDEDEGLGEGKLARCESTGRCSKAFPNDRCSEGDGSR